MHLCLDAFLQAQLALGQHLGFDVRAQVARDRIDGLVFLFNPQREGWPHDCSCDSLWAIVRQKHQRSENRDQRSLRGYTRLSKWRPAILAGGLQSAVWTG